MFLKKAAKEIAGYFRRKNEAKDKLDSLVLEYLKLKRFESVSLKDIVEHLKKVDHLVRKQEVLLSARRLRSSGYNIEIFHHEFDLVTLIFTAPVSQNGGRSVLH